MDRLRLRRSTRGIRPHMLTENEHENRGDGEEGRTQEEQDRAAEGGGNTHPVHPAEPSVPSSIKGQDELVDGASEDSFPASDPPAYWQRPAKNRLQPDERNNSPRDGQPDAGP